MSNALLSPTVAAVTGVISVTLVAVAARKCMTAAAESGNRSTRLALMGAMGAFIFAAQMINFAIPATGASGHIVGGILLAAVLGPWAGFLTMTAVLVIQALVFADGGFLALGCNIINMAAMSCLVAYPIFFRPLINSSSSTPRLLAGSLLASVMALFLGSAAVTAEASLSGITALPARPFLFTMASIHLAIGAGEGIATALVLSAVRHYRPDILDRTTSGHHHKKTRQLIALLAVAALIIGGSFKWVASAKPDGLEWSVAKITQGVGLANPATPSHRIAEWLQEQTALMPDYNTSLAGLIGSGAILLVVFITAYALRPRKKFKVEN